MSEHIWIVEQIAFGFFMAAIAFVLLLKVGVL